MDVWSIVASPRLLEAWAAEAAGLPRAWKPRLLLRVWDRQHPAVLGGVGPQSWAWRKAAKRPWQKRKEKKWGRDSESGFGTLDGWCWLLRPRRRHLRLWRLRHLRERGVDGGQDTEGVADNTNNVFTAHSYSSGARITLPTLTVFTTEVRKH